LRKQQGMTYKFLKDGSRFVHTFCEGELVTKLGNTPQDIVGKPLQQFIHDAKYVAYKESFYQRAWQGEEVSFEGRMNGVYYIASLRPVRKNHEVVEVIASCVDITQLKLVENDLRKSEQMYRLIAESSTDLIRILETDMTIRYASPSHEQVLGYLPIELEGIRCSELVVPEEREQVAQAFRDMIRRRGHHYQLNFHAQHKNGTSIMFETHGKPIRDGNGQIAGVVVVSRDLTNRMKEDEENRRRDKLTLAGQLAAGIAHEIRNPLAAIKGFTELLKIPSERQPFYTEVILAELARVEAIVNEFLLLAKPEATQYQQHDLYAIMTDVVTLLGPQAIMQRVQLQMSTMSERPIVYGAVSQLKQVFINILKNAIESMQNGGNVHLTIAADGNMVTVRIQDEGSGIKEEWLQRLGEPFYTTKEKGTGLGLMVSFKIVRDHGGNIAVKSSGAQGTCIEITLPVVKQAVATSVSQHSSKS
jgi:PAS domain S-box-containing protein